MWPLCLPVVSVLTGVTGFFGLLKNAFGKILSSVTPVPASTGIVKKRKKKKEKWSNFS